MREDLFLNWKHPVGIAGKLGYIDGDNSEFLAGSAEE